jgi:hypothetical protein
MSEVRPSLEEFNRIAELKRADLLFAAREEERLERIDRDRDDTDSELELLSSVVQASTRIAERVEQLRTRLDTLDAATVQALIANGEALDEAREHHARLLLAAHTLPDGRRVFKTEDGTRVFDEHGAEVSPEEIAPEEISDARPRAEEFFDSVDRIERLEAERTQLIEYQERLDGVREELDENPDLSADQLDALEAEMSDMPPGMLEITSGGNIPASTTESRPELAERQRPLPAMTLGNG